MAVQHSPEQLDALLEYLRSSRGFDFSGYKRTGLGRRIDKRVTDLDLASYPDYQDYLEVDPGEFARLFNTILINVTSFFRDGAPWDYLREEVVPALARDRLEPIRAWSAGCAAGQEAYSLMMVMAEVLGREQARARVRVYATDVDEQALEQARLARYPAKLMEGVPAASVERWFEQVRQDEYQFDPELRRAVVFGRHDLTKDAPISRIDLLLCRNTLMYFNAEAQNRILDRLHYALRDSGFLMLGNAEMLLSHASLFSPVDLHRRIFRKATRSTLRDHLLGMADGHGHPADRSRNDARLLLLAFQTDPEAHVVVDVGGVLCAVNDRARALFEVSASDVGRPFQDLDLSFRPVELRSKLQLVFAERRLVSIRNVEWPDRVGGMLYLDVHAMPVVDRDGRLLGARITFTDVSRHRLLHGEVETANQELEGAYAELQTTNEELETANEELQSTVEELETTNEELQSTNEELETANAEYRAANQELQSTIQELGQRTGELNEVNAYLESILSSFRGGVVVLDPDLRVQIWNHLSESMWGVRSDEAHGRSLLELDIDLPMPELHALLNGALCGGDGQHELVLQATNQGGHAVEVKVTGSPMRGADGEIRGVFVLMEELAAQS